MRATSPSEAASAGGAVASTRDDRVQPEAADGNVERRQRAEHSAQAGAVERDFFVRLAQRRLLERLARFDDAARQRHLAAVPAERVGADGQHDVRVVLAREEEQQAGGVAERAPHPAGQAPRGRGAIRACAAAPGRGLASATERSAIRTENERGNGKC